MKTYRQERCGITFESKRFVEKYLEKVGKVESVVTGLDTDVPSLNVTIINGERGKIIVDGFNWGYGGEGPRGLFWLLTEKLGWDHYTMNDICSAPPRGQIYQDREK